MKNKILIISVLLILALGIVFKDEFLFINIGDTYYLITYLSISIFLIGFILLVIFVQFISKRFS